MDSFLRDLGLAVRRMARAPGFSIVAVSTLALGIGAATAIFSVVNGVLLRPLPYPEPERLMRVWQLGSDGGRMAVSAPNFEDLQAQSRSFRALAQYGRGGVASVVGGTEPTRALHSSVSRDFFAVLQVPPLLGRGFSPEEQREAGSRAVVVSHGFWQRQLGGDPGAVGRALTFQNGVYTIVGVMPAEFDFPAGTELWTPSELQPRLPSRTAHNWSVIGRLKDGVTTEQARADVSSVARRLKEQYGDDTWMADATVVPLHEEIVGRVRPALLILLGAAGLLLLIACANVTNLLLAQAASRQRELAVRLALGAGRRRLVQQFLTESLALALAGGALGVALAMWGVDLLLALEPGRLPRVSEIRVDWMVLAFALGVSIASAAVLGLIAALRASDADVRGSLADSQRTLSGGLSGRRVRGVLVASQIALTLVLLVGAGLLARSFLLLLAVDPGFRTSGAVTMSLSLSPVQNEADGARVSSFHSALIARLAAIPGVTHVGAVNDFPLSAGGSNGTFLILSRPDEVTTFDDYRRLGDVTERTGSAEYRTATSGYFRAMDIPLLMGRLFDERDAAGSQHVAVISESLARTRWPDEDPIGKLIQFGNMDGDLRPFTIIGIVGDVRDLGLESEPRPTFYGNAIQRVAASTRMTYVMQSAAAPAPLIASAQRIVRDMAPEVPPRFRTLDEIFAGSLASRTFSLTLLGVIGATALLLAVMGIYSVMAYAVVQRTPEIGIRMALGAQSADVVRMVVAGGAWLIVVGLAVGLIVALAATRLLASLLFGVTPLDVATFGAVSMVLAAAALLASYIPARRATRVDPLAALRSE